VRALHPGKRIYTFWDPGVGQPSRAIIPGDDPGDQQPPERAIIKRQRDPHVARWRIEYS
jgi:hypothetical protein